MNAERVAAYLSLAGLTAAGFFLFPGHTILQSDTQIYLPILEHLWDPTVLARDPIATQPHVAFTIYDEVALTLRRLTGASFESILMTQQLVYRMLALFGCYLLARSASLDRSAAVLVAGVFGLGATIFGPAVLSIEYEPVPRGFALGWIVFSFGLLARLRWMGAAIAVSLALLFHPNTALPVWTLLMLLACWRRQWQAAAILAGGAGLLMVLALGQGSGGSQPLFGTIPPDLEALQRFRASYSWISLWIGQAWLHYLILGLAAMTAFWRLRGDLTAEMPVMALVLPLGGLLSIPVSYLLTEQWKWILMPQFQPGRYLVYTTIWCVLLTALAGASAAKRRQWLEAGLFLVLPFAISQFANFQRLPVSALILLPAALSICALLALRVGRMASVLPILLAIVLLPSVAKVRNFPPLHSIDLNNLASWARTQTDENAIFQFAGVGRGLEPGVFRARSQRALYVDWKSGGQVNFLPRYAPVWKERWAQVENPQSLEFYRKLGIDYVVFRGYQELGPDPVLRNSSWTVYRLTSP